MNVSPEVFIIVITGCWKQVYLRSCYIVQGSQQIHVGWLLEMLQKALISES